ncbi:hypothetical protein LEP1GSC121_0111 [Leptospira borgpetersenii serovar Castellonis str. 200801910]|uniref:Uncharacterized protein n=1 Tax=Leptospira borgpetersenii serovar Ballum TaxID=280505 RepID=A0A0S2IWJ1_LEPBO|nr:hypothetical protein LBBP_03857 [Leptospira borgpetersenii serovar Ballum]EKR00802.1 hypothetical protein LEP1GSC121_0111 [Leptospira borgpetersenii serovar Castellonis str. 200801910]
MIFRIFSYSKYYRIIVMFLSLKVLVQFQSRPNITGILRWKMY